MRSVFVCFLACALLPVRAVCGSDVIALKTVSIPLDTSDPRRQTVGSLRFRGGLVVSASDRRFGAWSGLWIAANGTKLLAVADEGLWLSAGIAYDGRGWLAGLEDARIGDLIAPDGRSLWGKNGRDAESLAFLTDGSAIVGFERLHRLWRYPGGSLQERPEPLTPPPGLERAPANQGLESLAALRDGRLLAITENLPADAGQVRGWIGRNGEWAALSYRIHEPLRPSDAAVLPNGDVLVLERSFSVSAGLRVQLRLIPANSIAPAAILEGRAIAEMRPPLNIDNFEGIAVRKNEKSETLVYLLSDDNQNRLQRTLLLMFALEGKDPGR